MIKQTFCLLLIVFTAIYQLGEAKKCGYDSCPKPMPDMLNVHLIPHTHDDVGWLKTLDQYYYGSKTIIQLASVQYIISSVITELLLDASRRFIYVESAFFFKWWEDQTDSMKNNVKMLVDQGRLEFIGGAWSMNDEATTNYQSTIDQFTWGLRRLNDTFGECGRPKVGWQIDPFGHSREFASLLAQMNYDGLFLGRIDYQDKDARLANKNAEMIWHASDNLGEKADLFTSVLYNGYDPPPGLCFDLKCFKDPIIDDENSADYNLNAYLKIFFDYVDKMKSRYRTGNLLVPVGGDFHYSAANMWYINLDKLIKHVNGLQSNGSKVNVFYSTPSCYLKSLHDSNITWPTKNDDFFPYASSQHTYWTGYFTSRPSIKLMERNGNNFLQVCKQLSALSTSKDPSSEENLSNLREAMGVLQHHDAVSGTEKQHVAKDYARLLQTGIDRCSENVRNGLNHLIMSSQDPEIKRENTYTQFDLNMCPSLNISVCDVTETSEKFMVTLYNPLARSRSQYVRVPVVEGEYEIMDHLNSSVEFQLVPIPIQIQSLFYRRSNATFELVFLAKDLPPVGYKSYFVKRILRLSKSEPIVKEIEEPIQIGNKHLSLIFINGLLAGVGNKDFQLNITQNFYLYKSMKSIKAVGDNGRASGAYIFRPNGSEADDIVFRPEIRVMRGQIVDEVHQTFNSWLSQVIRVYKDENFVEFQWLVGEIPVGDGIGREIITRFDTDIQSNGIFYTDSNGREMLKRSRNHRYTWNLNLTENVSGNYYPVTSKIVIEDQHKRIAILTDRAQGGSSLFDGSIELMIHRRLLFDDKMEVGEVLNEVEYGKGLIVRGKSYLVFGSKQQTKPSLEAIERFIQLEKHLPGVMFFSNLRGKTYEAWKTKFINAYSALSISMPKNVHLLTFEPWKSDSILLRFEHILSQNEDNQYSKNVTFNLKDVFGTFNILEMRETTLAGNQWLNETKRFKFETENENPKQVPDIIAKENNLNDSETITRNASAYDITLKPMEIRTFIIHVGPCPGCQSTIR